MGAGSAGLLKRRGSRPAVFLRHQFPETRSFGLSGQSPQHRSIPGLVTLHRSLISSGVLCVGCPFSFSITHPRVRVARSTAGEERETVVISLRAMKTITRIVPDLRSPFLFPISSTSMTEPKVLRQDPCLSMPSEFRSPVNSSGSQNDQKAQNQAETQNRDQPWEPPGINSFSLAAIDLEARPGSGWDRLSLTAIP